MSRTLRRVAEVAVVVMFAGACVGGAAADDGDTFPPPPPASTDPAFTGHDTTFDSLLPPVPLDENTPPPGGYIPSASTTCTSPGTGIIDPQWRLVGGSDVPVTLEGQVTSSKLATDDNQADHHSRDRNFFVFPDLAYAHLLSFGNFNVGEENELGRIETEWESAAFPAWALPMAGDRVHVEGSHIWDCAHGENGRYRTEIHPPRLVMTLRDAADQQWSNGSGTIPPRPGWADTMPGLGSVPVPVTRADVFGSSDGGEAREQLTCFHVAFLPPPPGCPPDWYQELRSKTYDLFVPAPPRPDPDAQLVTKLVPRPFLTCNSDDGCGGAVDELASHPERFTFTEENGLFEPGVHIHVDLTGPEPDSLLYGFGFTFEVGWNRPAAVVPRRLKVTILGVRVRNPLDGILPFSGDYEDGELEISSLIGDTFRHMRLTGNSVSYDSHQDVPDTEDVNVGDYGIKTTGSCGLVAPSGADTGACQNSFQVILLPGQPLRVFFRAEDHDFLKQNDEFGSVERITTEPNYGIGQHTEWFQERTSAGDDSLDTDCGLQTSTLPCLRITYKIEDDPIPAPPGTTLSVGAPVVVQGGNTWVTPASDLTLQATAPSGHAGDALAIHARFWRSSTATPGESVCGSGTGTASCTLHLDANDGADGQYTVEYWAVDTTTGAIEPTHTALFQRDATAPTTSASLAGTLVRGWYNTPVTVTLTATDGAGVGVDHTGYSVDGGLLVPYSSPFVVSSDSASHSVLFSSADKLTNTESFKSVSFKIDTSPPTLTASASDGTFSYTQDELVGGMFTNALVARRLVCRLRRSLGALRRAHRRHRDRLERHDQPGPAQWHLDAQPGRRRRGRQSHNPHLRGCLGPARDLPGRHRSSRLRILEERPGQRRLHVHPDRPLPRRGERRVQVLRRPGQQVRRGDPPQLPVIPRSESQPRRRPEGAQGAARGLAEPRLRTGACQSKDRPQVRVRLADGGHEHRRLEHHDRAQPRARSERRLEQNPSNTLLDTIQTLLEKLNSEKLNTK